MINKNLYYYLLPFFLGIITSFSLPPYNLILINFLTFPLFFIFFIQIQKNKSLLLNFVFGWLFGFGYFISNIYWIIYSLTFEDIFKTLIPFALIIIPSFLGLFYGLITLILSKFNLNKNLSSILIFSLVFSIIEFFRGFVLGGFPWNLIVYSWSNYINSLQILSIIGTYSFNLISITFFLLPILIWYEKKGLFKLFIFIMILSILFINNFYGSIKIKNNKKFFNDLENLSLKIISPKISIDRFFQENNEIDIIKELINLSNPDKSKSTIFIFPEGALSGISLENLSSFKDLFFEKFSENHIIIMGINTEKTFDEKDLEIYNSLVVLDHKLNLIHNYKKNKLVPFGEFLPLENFLKKIGFKKVTKGYKSFSAGTYRDTIFIKKNNFSFIPLICYEIIYSGKISKTLDDTNFIVNISEDGWFGDSIGPYQHFSHSVFRAIEEGKNIIRSSNNGISGYIDSNGIVIERLESTQSGVIEVNNYKKLERTIFSRFGNKIFFYFIIFYISLTFLIYKRGS